MQSKFQTECVHNGIPDFFRNHVGRALGLVAMEYDATPLKFVEYVAAVARGVQDVARPGEVFQLGEHDP